jgi:(p)ppGpp synthase/HD superfamily hydrolase
MSTCGHAMDLDQAIMISVYAHAGQEDKQGQPYILHCLRVMLTVSPQARVPAVLHDVIEDNPQFGKDNLLTTQCMTDELREILDCLTRREGEEYDQYILRVKTNEISTEIKRADLADNLDRINNLPPEDQARLYPRYIKALHTLRPTHPQSDGAK